MGAALVLVSRCMDRGTAMGSTLLPVLSRGFSGTRCRKQAPRPMQPLEAAPNHQTGTSTFSIADVGNFFSARIASSHTSCGAICASFEHFEPRVTPIRRCPTVFESTKESSLPVFFVSTLLVAWNARGRERAKPEATRLSTFKFVATPLTCSINLRSGVEVTETIQNTKNMRTFRCAAVLTIKLSPFIEKPWLHTFDTRTL
jgi:hypothetical protein